MVSKVQVYIDGDKVVVDIPGQKHTIRLSAVLARDLGEALYRKGWDLTAQMGTKADQ